MTSRHRTTCVTTPSTRQFRRVLLVVIACLMLAVASAGHLLVLLLGAADALIAARLGLPRLSWCARRVAVVAVQTWKETFR